MTKQEFLSGTSFTIGTPKYKGCETYYFDGSSIAKQNRSSIDERVIIDGHEANIIKVGRLGFSAYTFVLGKKVIRKIKFEDLVVFKRL
jgi:hypothetical protein